MAERSGRGLNAGRRGRSGSTCVTSATTCPVSLATSSDTRKLFTRRRPAPSPFTGTACSQPLYSPPHTSVCLVLVSFFLVMIRLFRVVIRLRGTTKNFKVGQKFVSKNHIYDPLIFVKNSFSKIWSINYDRDGFMCRSWSKMSKFIPLSLRLSGIKLIRPPDQTDMVPYALLCNYRLGEI